MVVNPWNLSAAIATFAVVMIFVAVYKKGKNNKDSPLYKVAAKFTKKDTDGMEEEVHYKRLPHRGGLKW